MIEEIKFSKSDENDEIFDDFREFQLSKKRKKRDENPTEGGNIGRKMIVLSSEYKTPHTPFLSCVLEEWPIDNSWLPAKEPVTIKFHPYQRTYIILNDEQTFSNFINRYQEYLINEREVLELESEDHKTQEKRKPKSSKIDQMNEKLTKALHNYDSGYNVKYAAKFVDLKQKLLYDALKKRKDDK